MNKTIKVGDTASITRAFTEEDVFQFAELSSDKNQVHLDHEFAATTNFGQRIVHGALVSSLFSALLGQHLPGNGAIYMQQNQAFKAPVFFNMDVTASVEVTEVRTDKPIVTLRTTCSDENGKVLITGEAVMFVPWLRETA